MNLSHVEGVAKQHLLDKGEGIQGPDVVVRSQGVVKSMGAKQAKPTPETWKQAHPRRGRAMMGSPPFLMWHNSPTSFSGPFRCDGRTPPFGNVYLPICDFQNQFYKNVPIRITIRNYLLELITSPILIPSSPGPALSNFTDL